MIVEGLAEIAAAFRQIIRAVFVLVFTAPRKHRKSLPHKRFGMEARVGIEPTDEAFAEPCLTTWLPRHH